MDNISKSSGLAQTTELPIVDNGRVTHVSLHNDLRRTAHRLFLSESIFVTMNQDECTKGARSFKPSCASSISQRVIRDKSSSQSFGASSAFHSQDTTLL